MKWIRRYFVAVALFAGLLGLCLILSPESIVHLFVETTFGSTELFFIRFIGTTLLGLSLLNSFAARSNVETMKLACLINIVSLAPATTVSVYGVMHQIIAVNRFLFIAEHMVLLCGFVLVYVYVRRIADDDHKK